MPAGNYVRFIEAYLEEQGSALAPESGEIVTTSGEVLGRHAGVHRYTVGQRRGLGLSTSRPLYVVALDRAQNRVIVGEDDELHSAVCDVHDVNWISVAGLCGPARAMVKIRHRHEPAAATVEPLDADTARVRFETPQRAVTPGQAAVFYEGERVLGGGWIGTTNSPAS